MNLIRLKGNIGFNQSELEEDDVRRDFCFLVVRFLDFDLSPFFIRLDFLCFGSSESLDEVSLDVDVELLLLLLLSLELDDDELALSDELDELVREVIKTF